MVAQNKYNRLIWVLSILIPIVVIILFSVKLPNVEPLTFLPPIYAGINAITAFVLVFALFAIRSKKIEFHKRLMQFALALSVIFLVMYVAYHMTSDPTPYGGEGFLKYVYYFILVTHILMSIVIIPMVLFTYVRGITMDVERHRKIARITFPLWLYVAITGVLVFILISPYYV